MFINKDAIKVNNISMGEYLTSVKYGFHDTWSSDTGYNTLAGNFVGIFQGTYPKFTLNFRALTPNEIKLLTNSIFRTTKQTIKYYDPSGVEKTITTHKGDLTYEFYGINKSKPFSYEFVGNERLK